MNQGSNPPDFAYVRVKFERNRGIWVAEYQVKLNNNPALEGLMPLTSSASNIAEIQKCERLYVKSLSSPGSRENAEYKLARLKRLIGMPKSGVINWAKFDDEMFADLKNYLTSGQARIDYNEERKSLGLGYNKDAVGGFKQNTINGYHVLVRGILKKMTQRDLGNPKEIRAIVDKAVVTPKDVRHSERPNIARNDYNKLLVYIEKLFNSKRDIDIRDAAIMAVLLDLGLRRSELVGALVKQLTVAESGNYEIEIEGKGNKVRQQEMSKKASSLLRKWLEIRNETAKAIFYPIDKSGEHLISLDASNNQPRHLSLVSLNWILKKHTKAGGLSRTYSPHQFRYTFANNVLSAGGDAFLLQRLLGHVSPATTSIYTHRTDLKLREYKQKYGDRIWQKRIGELEGAE